MTPARQAALGVRVETLSDPLAALGLIGSRPGEFALLLADMRMRPMNGLQLAKAAKKADPDLKVALMTSYVMDKKDAAAPLPLVGVDAFVAKPVSSASFMALLPCRTAELSTP